MSKTSVESGITELPEQDADLDLQIQLLRIQCHLNIILCYLKGARYHLVVSECKKLLDEDHELQTAMTDADRQKLLYRRATAMVYQHESGEYDDDLLELALQDLQEAVDLSKESDAAILQLQQRVKC